MLTRITLEVTVGHNFDGEDGEDARTAYEDVAERYVGSLEKYGHIFPGYSCGWCEGTLCYYVEASRPDAIEPRHYSECTLRDYQNVAEKFGVPPRIKLLGNHISQPFSDWENSSSLYLFVHAFSSRAAVTCGDTGDAIPPYLLPVTSQIQEGLYFWLNEYQACDRLWLASGALEMPAYKQIADPKSTLSSDGRELYAAIEAATHKPTYYYLMRYYGRKSGETTRRCPVCGGQWHQHEADAITEPFVPPFSLSM